MKIDVKTRLAFILAALVLLCPSGLAQAQPNNQYALLASVISSGGGTASGGDYTLVGVVGQSATGTASGRPYNLTAGFLVDTADTIAPSNTVYLPLIQR